MTSEPNAQHAAASPHEGTAEVPLGPPPAVESDPAAPVAVEARFRPTLLVGIGGTAARAFGKLQARLDERFGGIRAVPAMAMLLIDTDTKALVQATRPGHSGALDPDHSIGLPLRTAREYRRSSKKHLQWLSRRRLYNIPRSLRTEGLRPLGRLAMVDHIHKLYRRLIETLAEVLDPEALARSAKMIGQEADGQWPRVIVVASLCGGTGSGMALDVGYALRTILTRLGHTDRGLSGILGYSTSRHPNEQKLAAANAYACLSEWIHYAGPAGYPGDALCGLPPFAPGKAPFEHTYVAHLGEDLDHQQYDEATDRLAEFLYLNTVACSTAFFDSCREENAQAQPADVGLRTFGLFEAGPARCELLGPAADLLARSVIQRWTGDARPASQPAASTDSPGGDDTEEQLAERLELTYEGLQATVAAQIAAETGDDLQAYFGRIYQRYAEHREARGADPGEIRSPAGLIQAVVAVLGEYIDDGQTRQSVSGSLQAKLDKPLKEAASRQADEIVRWIGQWVDLPGGGLGRAQQAAERFAQRLRSIEADAVDAARQMHGPAAQQERALTNLKGAENRGVAVWPDATGDESPTLDTPWLDACRRRLELATTLSVRTLARAVRTQVSSTQRELADLGRQLGQMADQFDASPDDGQPTDDANDQSGNDPQAAASLRRWKTELPQAADDLDRALRDGELAAHGGLFGLIQGDAATAESLLVAIRHGARAAAMRFFSEANLAAILGTASDPGQPATDRLRECLQQAAPRLAPRGADARLLVVCPEGTDAQGLAHAVTAADGRAPTVLDQPDGGLALCYDVGGICPQAVAAVVLGTQKGVGRIAARLHTRIDVDWTDPLQ